MRQIPGQTAISTLRQ